MIVLVTGAGGMLARDITATAPRGVGVVAIDRAALDVCDPEAISAMLRREHPDLIINCAAYTAVDRAESEPVLAQAVNSSAPRLLADTGTPLLHFSTDYVFDGTATRPYRTDDDAAPLGVYGRTKLAGEKAIHGRAAVVRTAWLYGRNGRSFPRTMWQRARAGQAMRVVDDQVGRPTNTVDLAHATWRFVEHFRTGTFHATNTGAPVTWYGIAERIFGRAERSELLSACTTADYPTAARRPAWSVLDTSDFDRLVGGLPPWGEALERFLDVLEQEE